MIDTHDTLYKDLEAVQRISIVQTILEVICQTTGMGFAAVARVTDKRWLACSVRDEIGFGLKPGEELQLETTLCHEVRNQGAAIIIDHVAEDAQYFDHHTPKLYGLQSYISYPITLKNGTFFGTLCAIDPRPAQLKNKKTINTFALFADLLSFHLQSVELMGRSMTALQESNRQLRFSQDENRQYHHISTHTLKEPLRKIQLFSDRLVTSTQTDVSIPVKETALKLQSFARDLSRKIDEITELADIDAAEKAFEPVNLDKLITEVAVHLRADPDKKLLLTLESLPVIMAIPEHMKMLFHHLLSNAIRFSKPGSRPEVKIVSKMDEKDVVRLMVTDKGLGIENFRLQNIFNMFEQSDHHIEGLGTGLSICRKIIHQHGGQITAFSDPIGGTVFTITLPLSRVVGLI
ncbi:MAG: GAF domain-containing sensor histidine kinase [Chitinophagaceae bacterium]|nr:GAF domain-containing sensor histidine kinase [Chitinophagaceae bacterium]